MRMDCEDGGWDGGIVCKTSNLLDDSAKYFRHWENRDRSVCKACMSRLSEDILCNK